MALAAIFAASVIFVRPVVAIGASRAGVAQAFIATAREADASLVCAEGSRDCVSPHEKPYSALDALASAYYAVDATVVLPDGTEIHAANLMDALRNRLLPAAWYYVSDRFTLRSASIDRDTRGRTIESEDYAVWPAKIQPAGSEPMPPRCVVTDWRRDASGEWKIERRAYAAQLAGVPSPCDTEPTATPEPAPSVTSS